MSNIRGITVEIGGNVGPLQRALEGVNKDIKNTQSQLKDVERLLKLDPSNTELLSQKQKLLADAISETKDKLQTLKTASEQANEQLKQGTITQEQYDALQREIEETEQALKKLESQASGTNAALAKIDEIGGKFQKAGKAMTDAGKTLTTTVTAPIVALGTAAVKTTADFDEQMSKVAAISGATGEQFDALREKAREMGAKTKFSASEAGAAFEYMAMAGWKTEDMLSGIEGIMALAAASGEDLATTSDIVTDALTAFGLTAADSGHFADTLAGNNLSKGLADTYKIVADGMAAVKNATSIVLGGIPKSAEVWGANIGIMMTNGLGSSFKNFVDAVQAIREAARIVLANISKNAYVWGADISTLLANGIYAYAHRVIDAARYLAQSVRNILGFSLPKEGPLADADTYMPDFVTLLAKGIRDSKQKLMDSVGGLAGSMNKALSGMQMPALNASGLALAGETSRTVNVGGIQVSVNGYQAQNDTDLANMVARRLNEELNKESAVWG